MLDVEVKDSVPSCPVLALQDQQRPCRKWRTHRWIQQRVVTRTPPQGTPTLLSASPTTCLASPTPRSCAALPRVATSEALCWKRKTRACVQHSMRSTSLGPGRLATPYSTLPTRHVPDCSGTSTDWSKCCASSLGFADRSAYDWPANRSRKRAPAYGPERTDLQAIQPTHSDVARWQNASAYWRQPDVPQ